MWETVIGGLVVALLSALAILAYRDPEFYEVLSSLLFLVTALAVFVWMIISVGGMLYHFGRIEAAAETSTLQEVATHVDFISGRISAVKGVWLYIMAFWVYTLLLGKLPKLRQLASRAEAEE